MTKEEMLALCTWKDGEAWFGKFASHSPLFEREVEIHLLVETDNDISDRTVLIVNDFLKLNTDDLVTDQAFFVGRMSGVLREFELWIRGARGAKRNRSQPCGIWGVQRRRRL